MPVELPPRCPVAGRPDAGGLGQGIQAPVQVPRLRGGVDALHGFVQVPVVGNLVAAVRYPADHVRVAFGGESRDEERRLDLLALEDLQDPRDGDLGPVGLVRHE